MAFSVAPPGAMRKRREQPQRELTAANLAQQRSQPFEARMPPVKPKDGERNGLPLGREGAVCALCGNPGHDADVCADRPAPKLRISVEVPSADGETSGFSGNLLAEEPSMSELPDSPSALFPKPTPAEALARRKALEEEEAARRAAAEARHEKALRDMDELHRDVTDGGGPLGPVSRFDPYPLSPKRTFDPPPTREELLAAEAAAAEAAEPPKAGPPPLPRVDASLEGSEIVQGLAAWEYAKAKGEADAERVAKEEEARAEYEAKKKKAEEKAAARKAAEAAAEAAEGEGDEPDGGGAQARTDDPGATPPPDAPPEQVPPTDAERKAQAQRLLAERAEMNLPPGGGPAPGRGFGGKKDPDRQRAVDDFNPVSDTEMYVTTMVADRIHNIVATSIQPDAKLYEPEGGFAAMRAALVAAEEEAERRGVEIRELEHRLAVARVAEREERERHAADLERSNEAARSAMEEANKARLAAAAANASVAAIEARWDAELAAVTDDAEATKEAAKLASKALAEEAKTAREALEEHKEKTSRDAGKARDTIASLRRQLAEVTTRAATERADAEAANERAEATLVSFRNDAARWKSAAGEAERRAEEAERRAEEAERRAAVAEASERRLIATRRKADAAALKREELELEAANARELEKAAKEAGEKVNSSGGRRKGAPSSRAVTVTSARDDGLAAARSEALREASYELERETFAADEARAEARRSRRKAAEAEATAASDDLRAAPAHLRAAKLATRVFVRAPPGGEDELIAALETAGFSCATRGAGTEASPARASNAQVMCVVLPEDSADDASRMDPGTVEEMRAAQRAGRRIVVFESTDANETEERAFQELLGDGNGSLSTPPIRVRISAGLSASDIASRLAAYLGAPDDFLGALPAATHQAMASSAAKPFDFVGLRGAMALRFTDDIFDAKRLKALEGVLTASTCEVRDVRLPAACTPEIAAAAARACVEGKSVATLSFGSFVVPVAATPTRSPGDDAPIKLLDLTLVGGSEKKSTAANALTPTESAALQAAFGDDTSDFDAVRLPPRFSADGTRTALAALGAADGNPLPWIVNGVPGSIDAGATEIDLTDSTLGVPGALALGRALRVTPDHDSLRTLRLDRSTLGTEGGVVLAEALASKACAKLQHLHVAGASLGAAGVEAVCGSVPASLASLDLAANDGDDRGAVAAGRALRRCPLLVRLSVAANEIGAEGARALAPAIRDHSSLETLIASGNRVGDRGATALAAAIKATKAPFKDLFLDDNVNLSASSARSLASVAAVSGTLQQLDISRAMIGAEGAAALYSGLVETTSLRRLELSSCKLRADSMTRLAEALAKCVSLERLGLARNSLGDKGVFELCDGGLARAPALRELDLRHNAIGSAGADRLIGLLEKKNFVLRVVEMAGNKLERDEQRAVELCANRDRSRPVLLASAANIKTKREEILRDVTI